MNWLTRWEEDCNGCHLWQGTLDKGYGRVKINRRLHLAHRLFYEHLVGPIPDGMTIHHECKNRSCVNINHMRVVSRSEHARHHALAGDYHRPTAEESRRGYMCMGDRKGGLLTRFQVKWTDDDLITEMRRVKELVGDRFSSYAFNQEGSMWALTVIRRFGSWEKAKRAAGV